MLAQSEAWQHLVIGVLAATVAAVVPIAMTWLRRAIRADRLTEWEEFITKHDAEVAQRLDSIERWMRMHESWSELRVREIEDALTELKLTHLPPPPPHDEPRRRDR